MPNRPGNDDRSTATGGLATAARQRDGSSSNSAQQRMRSKRIRQHATRSNRGFASMDREKQKRDREQRWHGRARQGHRARIRFRRSTRSRPQRRRGREPQSRAHGGDRTSRRRSPRSVAQPRARRRRTPAATETASRAAFQNSRGGIANTDRQVAIDNRPKASTPTRRATAAATPRSAASVVRRADKRDRDETFGNTSSTRDEQLGRALARQTSAQRRASG